MDNDVILDIAKRIDYPTPLPIAKEILEYTKGDTTKIEAIINRIEKNEPWEYIKGYTHFNNLKISLNKNTLIPRKETEEFAKIAVKKINNIQKEVNIIDVGTGSGCIAIYVYKNTSKKNYVFATDISKKALLLAKENAKFNNCAIKFIHTNLIDLNIDRNKSTVILANLPYIETDNLKDLSPSVINYEPKSALDGGYYGCEQYKQLLEQIKEKNLNLEFALLEIDKKMIKNLQKYTKEYKNTVIKDMFGEKRFLLLEKY